MNDYIAKPSEKIQPHSKNARDFQPLLKRPGKFLTALLNSPQKKYELFPCIKVNVGAESGAR